MARPTSLQRLARRALLTLAKADTDLTDLVPAASIDPDGEPAWPIVLIESPRATPLRGACLAGAQASFDLHAFAGPREDAGAVVETGYDHVSSIGAQLETTFADAVIDLEDGSRAHISLSDMNLLKDERPDHWHWFAQLNARVLADVA